MFCLFVCLFQISQITRIYISYETTTKTKYEIDSTISLPAITFCTAKGYFLNKEFTSKWFSNSRIYWKKAEELLNELSVKNQFKALLTSEEVIKLIECRVMNTKNILNDKKTAKMRGNNSNQNFNQFAQFVFLFIHSIEWRI